MQVILRAAACGAMLLLAGSSTFAGSRVSVDRHSFNPSVGETVSITVAAGGDARVTVAVLDRDGYVTRRLAQDAPADLLHVVRWDGRDEAGSIVADEAYSFKVDVVGPGESWVYFPAAAPAKTYAVQARQYSRRNAALIYDLAAPARVHAQAGWAALDAKSGNYDGPVLKTLVNRSPRPAGAVLESWNGLDESGAIYVPDLPHFVTAILATELPENAVIAFGNRSRGFLDVAASRSGGSLLPPVEDGAHRHHHGLQALDDASPALLILPFDGQWDERTRTWSVPDGVLRLNVSLHGATARNVARQPGRIVVFIDYKQVFEREVQTATETVEIPLEQGPPRVISVNWQSAYGPLAANSIRVERRRTQ